MATIIPVTPALNVSSISVSETATIETTPSSTLFNTFFIRKKEYNLVLDAEKLIWERSKSNSDRVSILLECILAIKPQFTKKSSVPDQQKIGNETEQQSDVKQFTIYYAKRMENSSNPNKWRHFSQTFQNNDSHICEIWINALQHKINGKRECNSLLKVKNFTRIFFR